MPMIMNGPNWVRLQPRLSNQLRRPCNVSGEHYQLAPLWRFFVMFGLVLAYLLYEHLSGSIRRRVVHVGHRWTWCKSLRWWRLLSDRVRSDRYMSRYNCRPPTKMNSHSRMFASRPACTRNIVSGLARKFFREEQIHRVLPSSSSSSSSSSSKFIVRLLQNGHRCITESQTLYKNQSKT